MANDGERRVSRDVTTAAAADADASSDDDDDEEDEDDEVGEATDTPAGDSGSVSDRPELLPFARGVDSRLPNEAPSDRLPTPRLPVPLLEPMPLPKWLLP